MPISRGPKGRTDAPAFCPGCGATLRVGCDMWGLYRFCEDCGFPTDDDEGVRRKVTASPKAAESPPRKRTKRGCRAR